MVETEGQKAHPCLDHHFIGHLTTSLYAQPGDHGDCVTHLGQGHLDPLVALGGNLPHRSLGHVIHHEQRLARAHGMGPPKGVLIQVKVLLKG